MFKMMKNLRIDSQDECLLMWHRFKASTAMAVFIIAVLLLVRALHGPFLPAIWP